VANHRSHSIQFERQVAQKFLAGETLCGLEKRHDLSRNLIRVWVERYQASAFDDDASGSICETGLGLAIKSFPRSS
jgi:hypothetical protein